VERGEQKQAVGRSRGGRNTKIHALADAKGRLIAILLTGGEAHDCPAAKRLIRRVKPSKRMLRDKAYDSAELREELDLRGTKAVIPTAAAESSRSASAGVSTSCAGASKAPSTD
jgi:transposase